MIIDYQRGANTLFGLTRDVRGYAMIFTDVEGAIQNWNKGSGHLLGYRETEFVGRNILRLYSDEDIKSGLPAKLLRKAVTEGYVSFSKQCIRKDKSSFSAHMLIASMKDEKGRLSGFFHMVSDPAEMEYSDEIRRLMKEDDPNGYPAFLVFMVEKLKELMP